jgi:hypothetical protein
LFLYRNAVVELFNIGYYRMSKLGKYVDLPEIPMHGSVGKAPAWAKSPSRVSCDEGLQLFFEDLKSMRQNPYDVSGEKKNTSWIR